MTSAIVLDLPDLFAAATTSANERALQVDRLVNAFWANSAPSDWGCSEGELRAAETRIGTMLPPALRSAYQRWGRCGALSRQDRLLLPDRLEIHEGVLRFRIENQGAAAWGVRADDRAEDPIIYMTAESRDRSGWQQDLGTVSEFFVHIALSEALFADCHTDNTAVDEEELVLAAIKEHYEELAAPRFLWWPEPDLQPTHFFGGADVLIVDHASTWIWIAALTAPALDRVREVVPGDWELTP